jgi:hypothetical protein
MLSAVLTVVTGVLLMAAFGLVWFNRASPEVVGAAVPVAGAALSGLVLVFAFNKPAPIERAFPVLILGQRSDKQPIFVPQRRASDALLGFFSKAIAENSKLLDDPRFEDLAAGPLYHHLLQRGILDWISFRYSGTWRVRFETFLPGPRRSDLLGWRTTLRGDRQFSQLRTSKPD